MTTANSYRPSELWHVARLFSRVGACLLLFLASLFLIETISVLQDSSDYVWTIEGHSSWRYESEATYVTALIVEIAALLLAGFAL